jgi:hypothetical protein
LPAHCIVLPIDNWLNSDDKSLPNWSILVNEIEVTPSASLLKKELSLLLVVFPVESGNDELGSKT